LQVMESGPLYSQMERLLMILEGRRIHLAK